MAYPGSRWLLLRESLPTLKRTLIETFIKLYNDGLAPYIKDFNRGTWTITYHNGSQLLFMSESFDTDKELNRFRGLEINGAGIDELNEIQHQTFVKVIERAGTHFIPNMPPIKVLATCNPSWGWVKDKVYDLWEKDILPDSWAYIPAKITDNPHVPQEYLDSLKANMPEDDYRMFVDGDWNVVKAENPFFHAYRAESHLSNLAVFDPMKSIFMSIDFNLNPFGIIFGHIWKDQDGEHCHIFDELSIENGSIPLMIDKIKLKYGRWLGNCFLTGDSMGNRGEISQRDNASLYLQLQRGLGIAIKQMRVLPNPTHENSRGESNFVLHNFKDFKINALNCPGLARDMRIVQCDAFGGIIKRNRKDISQQADLADCLRYFFHSFLREWIYTNMKKIN